MDCSMPGFPFHHQLLKFTWTVRDGPSRKLSTKKLMLLNWCWRRLLSPLDCKEIKPVIPKGNQSWIFIGRTDAEAPIFWPPDAKNWLVGKDSDTGKDRRQEFCPKGPGTSDENENRTQNLVQWVRGPAASIGLRCRVHWVQLLFLIADYRTFFDLSFPETLHWHSPDLLVFIPGRSLLG